MNHTLEHVVDADIVLAKIYRILKSGGILFIDVPNAGGLGSKILKDKWPYKLPNEHNYQFTKESLSKVVETSGFKILHRESRSGLFEVSNPILELWQSLITFKKRFLKKIYFGLVFIIFAHICILSNLQFTAWPEMLSFPYVIDKGFLIYKDFHHVYQPLLTYILLGVYKIFGFNILALKTFTYVNFVLIDMVMFLTILKITKKKNIALLTTFIYVLLQPVFDGNMLWYDIGVILPVLLSLYFLNINLFLSGLFVAIAFLIKQQAVLLGLPMFIYLIVKKTSLKDIFKFLVGCIAPVAVLLLVLVKFNLFKDYLFWTFEFPLLYLPKIEGYAISPNTKEIGILILMGLSVLSGFILNFKKINSFFYVLVCSLIFMILSAFPRFSLFHLQPSLAVFVLIIGYLLSLNKKYFAMLLVPLLFLGKAVVLNPVKEDRFYSTKEFEFAENIKRISQDEKIYLLGPSSIYYVLTNTVSSKPWIENYVWHFEIQRLQDIVIDGWKIDPPIYIYWSKPEFGAWYDLGTYQPVKIVEYIKENYTKQEEISDVAVWKIK